MDSKGRLHAEPPLQPNEHEETPRAPAIPLCLLTLLWAFDSSSPAQNAQQLAFARLRAVTGKGQFNAVQADNDGNLYLLPDQKDGVRVLKTDPAATQIYAQAQLGAAGDIAIAMALDRFLLQLLARHTVPSHRSRLPRRIARSLLLRQRQSLHALAHRQRHSAHRPP